MVQSERGLISDLPDSLKNEISLYLHKNLIDRVPFFKDTDEDFIGEIILKLRAEIFLPGDYVFRKGDVGNCMYFIGSGLVNVLSEDESSILATLQDGDYFGEIALIKKIKRTRSIKTEDYCYLYSLEKNIFDALLDKNPKFKKHIYETIKIRENGSFKNHIKT